MLGGYKEVRCYRYEIFNGKNSYKRWAVKENYHEIVTITHWAELPEHPEED